MTGTTSITDSAPTAHRASIADSTATADRAPTANGASIADHVGITASAPAGAPVPATTTVVEPDIRPVTDDGDHDRFAHYTRRADANRAYVEGTPVRALCGKVWVPSRDPSRYPVCPECAKIREQLRKRAFN